MDFFMIVRIAMRALVKNAFRSFLTMLGIIIGVGAVIAMLSIGNGASLAMQQQIDKMGTNTVTVEPGYRRSGMFSRSGQGKLTIADMQSLAILPGVAMLSPVFISRQTLIYSSNNWSSIVYGVTASYTDITDWPVSQGRFFNESEVASGDNVVVLGKDVRRELFGASDPIGATIRVGNFPFKVIGELSEKGSNGWRSEDDRILVPYTTMVRKVYHTDQLDSVIIKAKSSQDVDALTLMSATMLNEHYNIANPADGGYRVKSSLEAKETAAASARIFSLLLGGVASISLLVGGIGIMNIMLVSVTERIREIGIRLAIGACARDILLQFLVEAIVLSLLGGVLGIALGAVISIVIASKAGWPSAISEGSVLLGFFTSVFTGVFFGFYPALSASRLDPIQALRSE